MFNGLDIVVRFIVWWSALGASGHSSPSSDAMIALSCRQPLKSSPTLCVPTSRVRSVWLVSWLVAAGIHCFWWVWLVNGLIGFSDPLHSWCPSAENSANQKGVPRQTRESLFLVPNWIRQISTWCWVAPWQELQSSVGICRNMHCPKVDATPTYTNLYLWHRTSWTTTWMVHITASTPLSRCHVVLVVKESIHHLIPPGMRWQDSQGGNQMANQNPVPLVNIKIAAPKISQKSWEIHEENHGKWEVFIPQKIWKNPIGFDSPNHRCLQFNLICKDLPGRAGLAVKGIPAV